MIKLLLVDDQAIFCQGLAAILSLEPDLEVVGLGSDGQEAIALAEQFQPDIILMDVRMPHCDGVTATREIHDRYPWIRILVLSTFDEDEYIYQALQAGALGYILKNTPTNQIIDAIRALHRGVSQLGPTIAPKVFAHLSAMLPTQSIESYQLSRRELEVLALLSQGKTNSEIAQLLFLSEGTVRNHISRILSQLGLHDRTQAALWAKQHLI
ncbi:response regulator [Leptolyngbya sp. AN03gr2]|uniref:response regulator n=1 Tax=unclassified Leptolyngbya TaxID=2650499 RepID=UPI003D31AEEE